MDLKLVYIFYMSFKVSNSPFEYGTDAILDFEGHETMQKYILALTLMFFDQIRRIYKTK